MIIPNLVIPVRAIRYKLPLKQIIPAINNSAVRVDLLPGDKNPQAIRANACVDWYETPVSIQPIAFASNTDFNECAPKAPIMTAKPDSKPPVMSIHLVMR